MDILCPICKNILIKENKSFKCINNHNYDLSSTGYLNLNTRFNHAGDNDELIEARNLFLNNHHYDFLLNEINNVLKNIKHDVLLDLACGEGYYTNKFIANEKYGIDLSKKALKIASKNTNTFYLLTTIFDLPFKDNCIDVCTLLFAPLPHKEILRVLKHDAYLIIVKPNKNHLYELKKVIYDDVYLNEDLDVEIDGFELVNKKEIKNKEILNNYDINNLFKMTPYYIKTSSYNKQKLENIDTLEISFEFILYIFKKVA